MSTPRRLVTDLRKKPPVPPPAGPAASSPSAGPAASSPAASSPAAGRPAAGPKPFAAGQPPLPAGVALTDLERRTLLPLGHREGDPLPPNMAHLLEAAQADARAAALQAEAPALPPGVRADHKLQLPPEVPLASLPAERQQEVADFLRQYKASLAQPAAPPPAAAPFLPEAGPGVNEAIAAASRPAPPPPPAAPPPAAKAAAPVAAPQPAEATEAAPEGDSGAEAPLQNCPHCHWDLARTDPLEITEEHRLAYTTAWLLGERYTQEVAVLGGRMRVRFRELTTPEEDMARKQAVVDCMRILKEGSVPLPSDVDGRLLEYMLLLSVAGVWTDRDGWTEFPGLAEAQLDPAEHPDTPLASYAAAVRPLVIPTAGRRKVFGDLFEKFARTLGRLDAQCFSASF